MKRNFEITYFPSMEEKGEQENNMKLHVFQAKAKVGTDFEKHEHCLYTHRLLFMSLLSWFGFEVTNII